MNENLLAAPGLGGILLGLLLLSEALQLHAEPTEAMRFDEPIAIEVQSTKQQLLMALLTRLLS